MNAAAVLALTLTLAGSLACTWGARRGSFRGGMTLRNLAKEIAKAPRPHDALGRFDDDVVCRMYKEVCGRLYCSESLTKEDLIDHIVKCACPFHRCSWAGKGKLMSSSVRRMDELLAKCYDNEKVRQGSPNNPNPNNPRRLAPVLQRSASLQEAGVEVGSSPEAIRILSEREKQEGITWRYFGARVHVQAAWERVRSRLDSRTLTYPLRDIPFHIHPCHIQVQNRSELSNFRPDDAVPRRDDAVPRRLGVAVLPRRLGVAETLAVHAMEELARLKDADGASEDGDGTCNADKADKADTAEQAAQAAGPSDQSTRAPSWGVTKKRSRDYLHQLHKPDEPAQDEPTQDEPAQQARRARPVSGQSPDQSAASHSTGPRDDTANRQLPIRACITLRAIYDLQVAGSTSVTLSDMRKLSDGMNRFIDETNIDPQQQGGHRGWFGRELCGHKYAYWLKGAGHAAATSMEPLELLLKRFEQGEGKRKRTESSIPPKDRVAKYVEVLQGLKATGAQGFAPQKIYSESGWGVDVSHGKDLLACKEIVPFEQLKQGWYVFK